MIQELLEANFLVDIGDDETKLEHINKTIQFLVNQLSKEPLNLIPATLIALDPQTNSDDQNLISVETELKRHWQTYNNKFPNARPIQLLRTIFIEAIYQLANKQDNFAAIIWYTGRSYLSAEKLGNETELLTKFLKNIGEHIETKVNKQWYLTIEHKEIKAHIDEIFKETRQVSLDPATIKKSLDKIWPDSADTADTTNFPALAVAINDQIISAINKASENLQKPINQLITLISEEIFKNKILWWKESKFSETLKRSYREINKILIPVTMAYDLQLMMPELHPESVECFLRENVCSSISEGKDITVLDFAKSFKEATEQSNLTNTYPLNEIDLPQGRQSLIGTLKICLSNDITEALIDKNLNTAGASFSLAHYAVWCFRDLQALKIAKTAAPKRRK